MQMMIITIDGEDEPATSSDPFAEIHRHPPLPLLKSTGCHRRERRRRHRADVGGGGCLMAAVECRCRKAVVVCGETGEFGKCFC
ncbi:hypothetical protein HanRHA438_Chr08g0360021 [Helianthus annuus]|nr:hypothetical protein HanRHA438_Chr08g0360021 [Helianthus annuus]